jgi:hypothetical protein
VALRRCWILLVACTLFAVPAVASPVISPIVDFTGGIASFSSDGFTWGFEFSVPVALEVDGLGFWDEGADGLSVSHDVGLWDVSSNLLAQVTVDNTANPFISSSSDGQWLFTFISPIVLPAGSYFVGAYFPDGSDALRQGILSDFLNIFTFAGVTYLSPERSPGSSGALSVPTLNQVSNGIPNGLFGPNLLALSPGPTPVPEPGSLLLIGVGLVLLSKRLFKRLQGE